MIRVNPVKVPVVHDIEQVLINTAKVLRAARNRIKDYRIHKKSIDARDRENVFFVYSVDVEVENEGKYLKFGNVSPVYDAGCFFVPERIPERPVVVGSGPAGLFAALFLAEHGAKPIIIERGKEVSGRKKDVELFFNTGLLNTESNVQFGEGGAGTFSDGKLTTGTHDCRIGKVLETFVGAGAPEDIMYESKPHIGTDNLINVVQNIRERIVSLGGEFRFRNKLTGLAIQNGAVKSVTVLDGVNGRSYEIGTESVILAVGHSARDTFGMLHDGGVAMKPKNFAVGFRIEHRQEMINRTQYGEFAKHLPPADYKLTHRTKQGRGVYTFCMCPGGVVIPAASEAGGLCINGMSDRARDGENANSAILVSVGTEDFGANVFDGINFQHELERAAYNVAGNYTAPVQLLGDFIKNAASRELMDVVPSYKPGYEFCNLNDYFDGFICDAVKEAVADMERRLPGFAHHGAVLTAIESRSSSPVTVVRDHNCESNIKGLFPCGEGAGYAGGIMSAAADGLRCGERVMG